MTVNMSLEVISMFVVPVMVRHKLSNCLVKTYAMLDTYIQATFAKENLLRDLLRSTGRSRSGSSI